MNQRRADTARASKVPSPSTATALTEVVPTTPTVTSAIAVVCRALAAPNTDVELSVAITQPGFFNQPDYYDVLARLRSDAPVFNSPNTWLVSRYEDIRAMSGRRP